MDDNDDCIFCSPFQTCQPRISSSTEPDLLGDHFNDYDSKSLEIFQQFKTKQSSPLLRHHPWQFFSPPSCAHLETLSFRTAIDNDDDDNNVNHVSFSITDEPDYYYYFDGGDQSLEMLVRGILSCSYQRLFFEPNGNNTSSSMLDKTNKETFEAVSENERSEVDDVEESDPIMVVLESEDPLEDFKRSMEEMVEFLGVKDWEGLEELLSWYLIINEKINEGFIVRAFMDLVSNLSTSAGGCSSAESYSDALSSLPLA
ncbi:transcription repressor OFP13-like [Prosopis cineraria]|uniref:transcription repressor OFP13-like n=1 Tax=Prosopis cineraria TaxID=364024 RepID=UPI00240EA62E|nr:transcription repressor OFP13-like [Prosopis cineraria]